MLLVIITGSSISGIFKRASSELMIISKLWIASYTSSFAYKNMNISTSNMYCVECFYQVIYLSYTVNWIQKRIQNTGRPMVTRTLFDTTEESTCQLLLCSIIDMIANKIAPPEVWQWIQLGTPLLIKDTDQYAAIYTWSAYYQLTIHYVYGQFICCINRNLHSDNLLGIEHSELNLVNNPVVKWMWSLTTAVQNQLLLCALMQPHHASSAWHHNIYTVCCCLSATWS